MLTDKLKNRLMKDRSMNIAISAANDGPTFNTDVSYDAIQLRSPNQVHTTKSSKMTLATSTMAKMYQTGL